MRTRTEADADHDPGDEVDTAVADAGVKHDPVMADEAIEPMGRDTGFAFNELTSM